MRCDGDAEEGLQGGSNRRDLMPAPKEKSRVASEEEEEDDGDTSLYHMYACGTDAIRDSADAAEGDGALIINPNTPQDAVRMGQEMFCSDRILKLKTQPYLRDRVTFFTSLANDAQDLIFKRCLRRISTKLIGTRIFRRDCHGPS